MSVCFYPAINTPGGSRPLLRCACDVLEANDLITDDNHECASCAARLNMNNTNAHDLLVYLGLDVSPTFDVGGCIDAGKLRDLCTRRLGMVEVEFGIAPRADGRVFIGGRDAGYLRAQCKALLVIATLAGSHGVAWS